MNPPGTNGLPGIYGVPMGQNPQTRIANFEARTNYIYHVQ
jgi:hypothetical protein